MENDSATVWPPPPSDTPQTYTVEGTEITKSAEQLVILAPSLKWLHFLIPATLGLLITIFGWLFSLVIMYILAGPNWKQALLWTPAYLFMGVTSVAGAWFTYMKQFGGGRFLFSRSTNSVFVSKQLLCNFANVKQIKILPVAPAFRKPYSVIIDLCGSNPNTGKPFVSKWLPYRRQLIGYFHDYAQAEIFAEEVAEFIGVPLID